MIILQLLYHFMFYCDKKCEIFYDSFVILNFIYIHKINSIKKKYYQSYKIIHMYIFLSFKTENCSNVQKLRKYKNKK